MKNIIILKLITLILLLSITELVAQKKEKISGTSLKILMKEGHILADNSPTISNKDYDISFIEMGGANFKDQIGDFDNIEKGYEEKGIIVKKNQKGKLGIYDALFITLESNPPVFQIFFGNKDFCAITNIVSTDTTNDVNEEKVKSFLSTIEYEESKISPLEEHANFIINSKKTNWEFTSYVANTFAFENKKSNDVIMIMQFPIEALALNSEKGLAEEFKAKLKEQIPNIETLEEGNWNIENLSGYRVLLNINEGGNEKLSLIYMFVFSSEKSVFIFQGMGEKNEISTKSLFDNFLKDIELKK